MFIESASTQLVIKGFDADAIAGLPCLMPFPQRILFWSLIAGLAPRSYLEIGTARGGSALLYRSAMAANGIEDFKAACIDPKFRISDAHKATLGAQFEYVEAVASPSSVKRAVNHTGALEFVLIDGDHRYDYALADLMLVFPYLARGAYIAFDDATYSEVKRAIDFGIDNLGLTDCGLMSRHTVRENKDGVEKQWSGLHVLRRV